MSRPPRDGPMRQHDLSTRSSRWPRPATRSTRRPGGAAIRACIDYIAVRTPWSRRSARSSSSSSPGSASASACGSSAGRLYLAEASRRRAVPMGWVGWQADFPDPASVFEPTLSTRTPSATRARRTTPSSATRSSIARSTPPTPSRIARGASRLRPRRAHRPRSRALGAHVHGAAAGLWHPYVRGHEGTAALASRLHEVWLDPSARPAAGGGPRAAAPRTATPLRALLARAALPR